MSQPISWLYRCECSPKGLTFRVRVWWPLAPESSLEEKQGWQLSAHYRQYPLHSYQYPLHSYPFSLHPGRTRHEKYVCHSGLIAAVSVFP